MNPLDIKRPTYSKYLKSERLGENKYGVKS